MAFPLASTPSPAGGAGGGISPPNGGARHPFGVATPPPSAPGMRGGGEGHSVVHRVGSPSATATPTATAPALPLEAGIISPRLIAMAHTSYTNETAYGKGPRSLVYSHHKRAILFLAAAIILFCLLILPIGCVYGRFCSSEAAGLRSTYSTAASDAFVPSVLVLGLLVAPAAIVAARAMRPALVLLSTLLSLVVAVLCFIAGVGSLAVLGDVPTITSQLWSRMPSLDQSVRYGGSQARLEAEVRGDIALVTVSALVAGGLTLPLCGLTLWLGWQMVAARHAALAAGTPAWKLGWWRVSPIAAYHDTQYGQLLAHLQHGGASVWRPTVACSFPDCCGCNALPAWEWPSAAPATAITGTSPPRLPLTPWGNGGGGGLLPWFRRPPPAAAPWPMGMAMPAGGSGYPGSYPPAMGQATPHTGATPLMQLGGATPMASPPLPPPPVPASWG